LPFPNSRGPGSASEAAGRCAATRNACLPPILGAPATLEVGPEIALTLAIAAFAEKVFVTVARS